MKKIVVFILLAFLLIFSFSCAKDTKVEMSGLELEEVEAWTKKDCKKASNEERVEALYLLIDNKNDEVDAGTSAIVSVKGFTEAFEEAGDDTTLLEIFSGATFDEITYDEALKEADAEK